MLNSKELLGMISEEKRKECVKNKNLFGNFPKNKALRMCWNIGNKTFSFKISLDRKPVTKRGLISMIISIYDPLGFAAIFMLERRKT